MGISILNFRQAKNPKNTLERVKKNNNTILNENLLYFRRGNFF
jgi:hypothetical protein